jgi:hypothetical protein
LVPATAFAEAGAGKFSGGVKLGMFSVDAGAVDGIDNVAGYSADIDGGFGFGLHGDYQINSNWYVDVEYMSTSLDMTVDRTANGATTTTTSDVDVSSFAVYGAYRSSGDWYYMGKLGLVSESISGDRAMSKSDMGVSISFGGGYKIQENMFVEAEYTSVEKDIGFIGLTARYTFN